MTVSKGQAEQDRQNKKEEYDRQKKGQAEQERQTDRQN
jgi:hypothetical protein